MTNLFSFFSPSHLERCLFYSLASLGSRKRSAHGRRPVREHGRAGDIMGNIGKKNPAMRKPAWGREGG